jgi:hypothetical protein
MFAAGPMTTGNSTIFRAYQRPRSPATRLGAPGGTLALAVPQPIVAKVLAISGLDGVLTVHTSVVQATALSMADGEPTPATER